ncbi:N-alpha-acetyltransferase 30 [Aplysia californica]|uniref:N-alpha-acetyltransferase 30 n=1 Tax=Aplysia californica TaxID=6500 RepID=A0ABM0JRB2_APLCA|nr:N-alpha-acetyltransferase 30 [Aplysia californica]
MTDKVPVPIASSAASVSQCSTCCSSTTPSRPVAAFVVPTSVPNPPSVSKGSTIQSPLNIQCSIVKSNDEETSCSDCVLENGSSAAPHHPGLDPVLVRSEQDSGDGTTDSEGGLGPTDGSTNSNSCCEISDKAKCSERLNGLTHATHIIGDNGISKHLLNECSSSDNVDNTQEGRSHSCSQSQNYESINVLDRESKDVEVSCDKGVKATVGLSTEETSACVNRDEVDDLLGQLEKTSLDGDQHTVSSNSIINGITYIVYGSERQMPDIMRLITKDLSEPYSIYTYRYFIHNWPKLCFLAVADNKCVGAIVCKLDLHKKMVRRGYIAMLAVDSEYRRRQIGSTLVTKAIQAMIRDDCDEVVLETEITNQGALHLYENLGFVRDKRLFRYYLNGVDALRLKLWLR